jgi:hypothetical protein
VLDLKQIQVESPEMVVAFKLPVAAAEEVPLAVLSRHSQSTDWFEVFAGALEAPPFPPETVPSEFDPVQFERAFESVGARDACAGVEVEGISG